MTIGRSICTLAAINATHYKQSSFSRISGVSLDHIRSNTVSKEQMDIKDKQ
jgi:hypothetical protein